MIEIVNKPLLLHLVGYLYYWQMGFNSVFKGLRKEISLKMGVKISSTSTSKVVLLKEELIFEVLSYENPSLCDTQCQACNVHQTLTRMYYWSSEVPTTSDRFDVWYWRLNTS